MAFAGKLGSLLKKTTSANPSLFQAIRCMSSSKLFVGGLSYNTDEQSLKDEFENYGTVVESRIILDRETGRSRGFGFVTYTSSEEASAAITALDGKDLHGRTIRVNHATERTGGFRSGGGGFGSGGGYGGGYSRGGYGSGGGGDYGNNYGNRRGGYGGGGDYGVAGGAGGSFAAGGSDNFAGSNFGADSGFGGNPAGGFGAAGGDEFTTSAPGDNFSSGKNDDIMGDLFKDDERDNFANKSG
ncbi:hypothetical protein QOZ80_5BG0439900 [Eleusine coracana subsp. coracana]|nr:hypothetical protein QOZ80_5BG0439900 [Eleusine coracana subsp. coracana]